MSQARRHVIRRECAKRIEHGAKRLALVVGQRWKGKHEILTNLA